VKDYDYEAMLVNTPTRASIVRDLKAKLEIAFVWKYAPGGHDFWEDVSLLLEEIADGAEEWQREHKS